jgi:hypothetical protein
MEYYVYLYDSDGYEKKEKKKKKIKLNETSRPLSFWLPLSINLNVSLITRSPLFEICNDANARKQSAKATNLPLPLILDST